MFYLIGMQALTPYICNDARSIILDYLSGTINECKLEHKKKLSRVVKYIDREWAYCNHIYSSSIDDAPSLLMCLGPFGMFKWQAYWLAYRHKMSNGITNPTFYNFVILGKQIEADEWC
jgi:hypothetical protein